MSVHFALESCSLLFPIDMTRRILILTAITFAIAAALISFNNIFPHKSESERKTAHLSIDDVEIMTGDIIRHQDEYNSIFDNRFLSFLKDCHDEYGAKFTLYTYAHTPAYSLREFPDKFKDEFYANRDWLRFGFHWIEPAFREGVDVKTFKEAFHEVNTSIERFAGKGSISRTLRLHYFYLPDSLRDVTGGVIYCQLTPRGAKATICPRPNVNGCGR